MKKLLITITTFLVLIQVQGQSFRLPPQAAYPRSSAFSLRQADAFSFSANAASLALLSRFSAGAYLEKPFLLQELSLYQLVLALSLPPGQLGWRLSGWGSDNYQENSCSMAFARSLGTALKLGVQFHYYRVSISSYGRASAVLGEAGLLYQLNPQWTIGFNLFNPGGRQLSNGERVPGLYSAGIGFDASDKLCLCFDLRKEEGRPVDLQASVQYALHPRVWLRAGLLSSASVIYLGLGFRFDRLRLDAAAQRQALSGITPALLLHYQSGKP